MVTATDWKAFEAAMRVKARKGAGRTPDQQAELDRCKGDIVYWINKHCWTYDPRPEAAPNHLRFELYPFQVEYVQWLEDCYQRQVDGFTEKSRDGGITWATLAWMAYHWRFDDSFDSLIGSRKEDLVDNRQLDSHFGRLQYIIDRLPDWMRPDYERTFMKLVNKANGNAIIGESANPNFSRQGRYSAVFLDEFGFWPWARSVWTATADATKCRIVVTTPEPGSFAKELRYSGKIPVRTIHWRAHPHKDEAWYAAECERRTAEDIAKELDINWEGSLRGLVYGDEWNAIPRGEYPYVPGWPLFTSWDFGLDGTPLIWWQRNPTNGKFRAVDCYANSNKTIDFYVPWCTGLIKSGLPYGYSEREIAHIASHGEWPGATHFGDPDVAKRNLETGRSTRELLAIEGIHVQAKPDKNDFMTRWQETKLFLRRVEGINVQTCALLDDAMKNARFPQRPENSQSTGETVLPIHDWTSHFRTAVEYMAVNAPPPSLGTGQPRSFIGAR